MRTVWKYKIGLDKIQTIEMPHSSQILSVQKMGLRREDEIFMWVFVNPDEPTVRRKFLMVGTGEELPPGRYEHVTTLIFMQGTFVAHLFEVIE